MTSSIIYFFNSLAKSVLMFHRRTRNNVRNGNFEVRAEFIPRDSDDGYPTNRIIFDDFAVFATLAEKGLKLTWIDLEVPEPEFRSGFLAKHITRLTRVHAAKKNLLIFLVYILKPFQNPLIIVVKKNRCPSH